MHAHSPLRSAFLLTAIGWTTLTGPASAADPAPPEGFRAIFNGQDLSGWYGWNPHESVKLTGDELEANLRNQREAFAQNWTVENGELVNDGHGPYATTDEDFGDLELLLEYKTVAKADSGIYLRGTPQVQIWDWNQVFNPAQPTRARTWGPEACSTTLRGRRGAIRWRWRTGRSASGTSSASGRSAAARGSGSTTCWWSTGP